jgi:hypothetical protein
MFYKIAGIILLFVVQIISQEVDLEKANELFKNSKGFEALQLLSPCLKAKLADEYENLEKCLYLGEQIACTTPPLPHIN